MSVHLSLQNTDFIRSPWAPFFLFLTSLALGILAKKVLDLVLISAGKKHDVLANLSLSEAGQDVRGLNETIG